MKIAIAANDKNLDSEIAQVFNSAEYFLIFDTDKTEEFEIIRNPHTSRSFGSEIFGAHAVVDGNVVALVAGSCTAHSSKIFGAAGIRIIDHVSGTVRENIPYIMKLLASGNTAGTGNLFRNGNVNRL